MKRFLIVLPVLALLSTIACSAVFSADENIARGCPVSYSADPAYQSDRSGKAITDGRYITTGLWKEPGAIAWETKEPIGITIDLGKVQAISGVAFDGVREHSDWSQWPAAIMIYISDDSKTWHFVGDLTKLSSDNPPDIIVGGPKSHEYVARGLKEQGRYVRLMLVAHMESVFCDEIEVYGGERLHALTLSKQQVKDTSVDTKSRYFDSRVQYRLNSDLKAVRKAVANARISNAMKSSLNARLDDIAKRIPAARISDTPSFRAILPINGIDAKIFAIYGELLKSSGRPALFAWKADRYALLSPVGVPQKPAKAGVSIVMMKNEYRADSILLTNASKLPVDVKLTLQNIPGAPKPEWLSVYALPWTDTNLGTPIAAALVPAKYANGKFTVQIPAGMTSKIWLSVDSSKLNSGNYDGKLVADCHGQSVSMPFNVRVSSIVMARPRLSFCEWDYTFTPGAFAITPGNIEASVKMMREHFVDSPWCRPENMKLPGKDAFDAQGNLAKPLTFPGFDTWVKRWPDARYYLIYLDAPTNIGGYEMGTPEFEARVRSWAKGFAHHIESLGLKPEQFGIMIKDEPSGDALKVILAWAKSIKEAVPGMLIFQDCNNYLAYKTPTEVQAHNLANISCPELGPFHFGGPQDWNFFANLVSPKHTNWFYQCYGPTHVLDPYQYNRMEGWNCFKFGMTGMGLWAFADTGVFKNSWNEYAYGGPSYSPVFFNGDELYSGIHYEGSREGIEDNEYLMMLKDAAEKTTNASDKAYAENLLSEAVNYVLSLPYMSDAKQWTTNKDRSTADTYRIKILDLLEKMTPSK